jgi:hypothetical protein
VISEFVATLDEEAKTAYRELLEIGKGGSGTFYEQLKWARDKSFHYQELFLGDHEEREPLKRAMAAYAQEEDENPDQRAEIQDIPPPITGFRAIFAYDIASEMLLPEDTEGNSPEFIANISEHIAKFVLFTKDALNAYAQTKPAEVWEVEEVEEVEGDPKFLNLLRELQTLIGKEVTMEVLVEDRFFGLSYQAQLERVETVPDSQAIMVLFSNGVSFDLAPGEQALTTRDHGLELRIGSGLAVVLNPVAASGDGTPDGPRDAT